MQITGRDITLFEFINQFGFCDTIQLAKRFDLKPKQVNKITRRLVAHAYLIKQKEFFGRYALYRLTHHAAEFTALPAL